MKTGGLRLVGMLRVIVHVVNVEHSSSYLLRRYSKSLLTVYETIPKLTSNKPN